MTTHFDTDTLLRDLDADGYALRPLLDPAACRDLATLYDRSALFRKRIVMEQRAYGRGEYQYFAYPLPDRVERLREALYPALASVANAWAARLKTGRVFPPGLEAYLAECHAAGQTRATPLLLRYDAGGFNCLHQDLYGDLVFPLQVVVLLSDPATDFTGGEFVLMEQRPRAQSRAVVVTPTQGQCVVFPVHHRPGAGARGAFRLTMRHGVSRVHTGRRQTLGLIFHDAA